MGKKSQNNKDHTVIKKVSKSKRKNKGKNKKKEDVKKQLDTLRTENQNLEQRLAAALLVSEQQTEHENEPSQATGNMNISLDTAISSLSLNSQSHNGQSQNNNSQKDAWAINMEWFFGSLLTALILGFVAGMTWLDNRSRQRHGGFRIY